MAILGCITDDLEISRRKFAALVFLFSGSLAWFLTFQGRFGDIFVFFFKNEYLVNVGSLFFLLSVIGSALFGSLFVKRVSRKNIIFYSTLLGVLSSISLVFFYDPLWAFFCSILGGVSFGFVMPSVASYFTDSTVPEERGRVSGFIVLSVFIFLVVCALVNNSLGESNSIGILSVTICLRLTGFLPFFFDSIGNNVHSQKSWSEILKYRDFLIYALAFILFNICSGLVSFIWHLMPDLIDSSDYIAANQSSTIVRYVGIVIISVVTGFLADRVGRKKPVIIGVVILGIAYALVGLNLTPDTYFLQMVFSGLAWGILIVLYIVIPGDLAFVGSEEKFYILGVIIPSFVLYTGINGAGRFFILDVPLDIFSTFLSAILFVSVIPILYAKETLSESKIKMARIKDHIKKVHELIKNSEENNN